MRCFTLEHPTRLFPFIAVAENLETGKEPEWHILLGKADRFSTLTAHPLGQRGIIERGITPPGSALLHEYNHPFGDYLVCVRNQSPAYGSWLLHLQDESMLIAEAYVGFGMIGYDGGGPEYLLTMLQGDELVGEIRGTLPNKFPFFMLTARETHVDVDFFLSNPKKGTQPRNHVIAGNGKAT